MKAVIQLDVPDWQIGQEVSVYFPDTMIKRSVCKTDSVVLCKDCKHGEVIPPFVICRSHITRSMNWFCADGEREE